MGRLARRAVLPPSEARQPEPTARPRSPPRSCRSDFDGMTHDRSRHWTIADLGANEPTRVTGSGDSCYAWTRALGGAL